MQKPLTRRSKLTCKGCAKIFTPSNPRANNQRFCALSCRADYYRVHNRAYIRQWQAKARDLIATAPDPDKLQCAYCLRYYKRVARHAQQAHGVTARQYKRDQGLDNKRGLLTDEARAIMADHTKGNGTIHNLQAGKPTRYKPNDPRAGHYERSEQTLARLALLHTYTQQHKTKGKSRATKQNKQTRDNGDAQDKRAGKKIPKAKWGAKGKSTSYIHGGAINKALDRHISG